VAGVLDQPACAGAEVSIFSLVDGPAVLLDVPGLGLGDGGVDEDGADLSGVGAGGQDAESAGRPVGPDPGRCRGEWGLAA
jgi:hypothetical protein